MDKMPLPEKLHIENSSFLSWGMQHVWDSTSLGSFKSCPRKYFYEIIWGYRARREATPLTFGIYYQKAVELFEKALASGDSFEAARRVGMRFILETKWESDDKVRNIFTLLRSFVWYLEEFQEDKATTLVLANGKPAVELSFTLDTGYTIDHGTEGEEPQPVMLAGHFDRIVEFGEFLYVEDNKTTTGGVSSHYFERYSPDNQVSIYAWASKVVFQVPTQGVLINACHITQGHTEFARRAIPRSTPALDEWHAELGFWLQQAESCAKAKSWPMNDKACFLCSFKEVCRRPASLRPQVLESNFQRQTWNPLERR